MRKQIEGALLHASTNEVRTPFHLAKQEFSLNSKFWKEVKER
jgi:hypothetical protein